MSWKTNQADRELKVAPVGKCHRSKGGDRLNKENGNAGTKSFHLSDGKGDACEVARQRDESCPVEDWHLYNSSQWPF